VFVEAATIGNATAKDVQRWKPYLLDPLHEVFVLWTVGREPGSKDGELQLLCLILSTDPLPRLLLLLEGTQNCRHCCTLAESKNSVKGAMVPNELLQQVQRSFPAMSLPQELPLLDEGGGWFPG
jgi:hypothetical protein